MIKCCSAVSDVSKWKHIFCVFLKKIVLPCRCPKKTSQANSDPLGYPYNLGVVEECITSNVIPNQVSVLLLFEFHIHRLTGEERSSLKNRRHTVHGLCPFLDTSEITEDKTSFQTFSRLYDSSLVVLIIQSEDTDRPSYLVFFLFRPEQPLARSTPLHFLSRSPSKEGLLYNFLQLALSKVATWRLSRSLPYLVTRYPVFTRMVSFIILSSIVPQKDVDSFHAFSERWGNRYTITGPVIWNCPGHFLVTPEGFHPINCNYSKETHTKNPSTKLDLVPLLLKFPSKLNQ